MMHTEHWSHSHVEKLMEISTALAEYTRSLEACEKIPPLLSAALDIGPVTLAVIEQRPEREARVLHLSCSAELAGERAGQSEILQLLGETETGYCEVDIPGQSVFPRAGVFTRCINRSHRMCLMVHQSADQTSPAPTAMHAICLIAGLLAKLLCCTCACAEDPGALGTPFNRLTGREWMVLQNLNSEDGEKQLADRMHLSAHTLHSHIKSIYRKVGVQGRLSLLLRLQEAQRELRAAGIVPHLAACAGEVPGDFVAIG